MFIRKRNVKGPNGRVYVYYGIVETQRIDGKVRQKMLYNMGKRPTISECIAEEERWKTFFSRYRVPPLDIIADIRARIEWLMSIEPRVTNTYRGADLSLVAEIDRSVGLRR